MAQKSIKQNEVKTVTVNFDGGLNLQDSPAGIADNQQIDCRNFYYANKAGLLVTRPGVKAVVGTPIGQSYLTVNIFPADIGAWRLVGETAWRAGWQSVLLSNGSYTVEFQTYLDSTPSNSVVLLLEDTAIAVGYSNYLYLESSQYAASATITMAESSQIWPEAVAIGGTSQNVGAYSDFHSHKLAMYTFKPNIPAGATIGTFLPTFRANNWTESISFGAWISRLVGDATSVAAAQVKSYFLGAFGPIALPQNFTTSPPDLSGLMQRVVNESGWVLGDRVAIFMASVQCPAIVYANAGGDIQNRTATPNTGPYVKYSYTA